jgi:hypothetical protein
VRVRTSDAGYTVYETYELHVPILDCHCEHQRCNGKFIQTHEGQTECIFSLSEHGLLEYLPLLLPISEESDLDEII